MKELVFVGQRCPDIKGKPTETEKRPKRDTESRVAEPSSFEADA